jgi:hypothetical protein
MSGSARWQGGIIRAVAMKAYSYLFWDKPQPLISYHGIKPMN